MARSGSSSSTGPAWPGPRAGAAAWPRPGRHVTTSGIVPSRRLGAGTDPTRCVNLRSYRCANLGFADPVHEHGTLHASRVKHGAPSVHVIRGQEIQALRCLKREQVPPSPYVFTTERSRPMTVSAFGKLKTLPRKVRYLASNRWGETPWHEVQLALFYSGTGKPHQLAPFLDFGVEEAPELFRGATHNGRTLILQGFAHVGIQHLLDCSIELGHDGWRRSSRCKYPIPQNQFKAG